jgi:glycerol-3-phosphate dehydrogenase (NAD(P)+)
VQAAGGDPTTAFGLAGLGDLIVAREANSRDVEAGRMLARGAEVEHIHSELGGVDGFRAAPIFASLAQQHGVEAHFTDAVNAISRGELDGPSAMRLLMTGVGHLSE